MEKKKRILIIEPYYGGSHQAFLQGLAQSVTADFRLLTLPARRWKMRMQLSAPWFAEQVASQHIEDRWYDTVLCSTFVDVALLRALLQQINGWNPFTRYCTYFHENQFAYPGQYADDGLQQFQAINFTTALASDSLAFNSSYNRDTFFEKCSMYLRKSADMCLKDLPGRLHEKSSILHPGLDYFHIDNAPDGDRSEVPVIVWNHRWEHDKNPKEFFATLRSLKDKGFSFNLIILGQSFSSEPACFSEAKEVFSDSILHFGYAKSNDDYGALLKRGDIVVSTAVHEFFGISVLEAVRARCRPVLPRRLSYVELFPAEFLYGEGELEDALVQILNKPARLSEEFSKLYTSPYSWSQLAQQYGDWLFN